MHEIFHILGFSGELYQYWKPTENNQRGLREILS